MKKVKISIMFGKFKKTSFTDFEKAIIFVRKNRLPYTQLKQTRKNGLEVTWDNF